MKYAWIENGRIRDLVSGDPHERLHPEVAALYMTPVPDDAQRGDGWVDGALVKPQPPVDPEPVEQAPVYLKVSPVEFKLLFAAPERVAIKGARLTDQVIDDFYDIVEDPRLTHVDLGLQSTQDALSYLVAQGLLTEVRRSEILSGKVL